MNKLITSTVVLSSLLLVACAQTRGYTPAVDSRASSPTANANYNRDLQECQTLATQSSGNTAAETAIGAGVGGAVGAAAGAVVGAVADTDVATAAMIGGAAVGLAGAAKQGYESDSQYKQAFNSCMSSRGHRVVD